MTRGSERSDGTMTVSLLARTPTPVGSPTLGPLRAKDHEARRLGPPSFIPKSITPTAYSVSLTECSFPPSFKGRWSGDLRLYISNART